MFCKWDEQKKNIYFLFVKTFEFQFRLEWWRYACGDVSMKIVSLFLT